MASGAPFEFFQHGSLMRRIMAVAAGQHLPVTDMTDGTGPVSVSAGSPRPNGVNRAVTTLAGLRISSDGQLTASRAVRLVAVQALFFFLRRIMGNVTLETIWNHSMFFNVTGVTTHCAVGV
jgi:hypothetical protein